MLINKIQNEAEMLAFAAKFAAYLPARLWMYLHGELGAGKTTFVRGLLRGLGYEGIVKSPTYTLVEPYTVSGRTIYHFDLYRIIDEEELELIGFRDYFTNDAISLIEWPQRAASLLPEPDMNLYIKVYASYHEVHVEPLSDAGNILLQLFII